MDDELAKQLEGILAKSEAKDRKRTMKFFRQMKSIEEPSQEDTAFILRQMGIHKEAVLLWQGREKGAKLLPLMLFIMGRTYERYYFQKAVGAEGRTKDAFTKEEGVRLTAYADENRYDDYDEKFYELLWAAAFPTPDEMDGRLRRAISKFCQEFAEDFTQQYEDDNNESILWSLMTVAMLKGYALGKKLRRPLTRGGRRMW